MTVTSAVSAARTILTRLHDVMASRNHAQAKLNTVVEIIGEGLDSEVCSIYLLREGMLELFATRGLAQEAVHVTRMAIGEGLVGTIAANIDTLNLAEATAHPDFSYRPETGEDKFHSFAGVPIVRRERAVGVLCVQHVDPRRYEEVEIEALQTTAMVLSELIANADLVDEEEVASLSPQLTGPQRLHGLSLVKGLAAGVAVFHQPRITIDQVMADDRDAELQRVYLAFDKMREQIDRMAAQAEFGVGGEHEEVLETYKMFAYDEGWSRRIIEAIDSGLTAEAAIERVQQRTRMRMRQIDDPLLALYERIGEQTQRLAHVVGIGREEQVGVQRREVAEGGASLREHAALQRDAVGHGRAEHAHARDRVVAREDDHLGQQPRRIVAVEGQHGRLRILGGEARPPRLVARHIQRGQRVAQVHQFGNLLWRPGAQHADQLGRLAREERRRGLHRGRHRRVVIQRLGRGQ